MNIKIWDKESNLKNLDKEVWFKSYPRSKTDTLVLVDNSDVYFLEDIKSQGFKGDSDIAIVEAFLKKQEEDRLKLEQEQKEKEQQEKTENEKLKEQIKNMQLEHSLAMAELIEKVEKDKVDLSAAIAEVIEMQINGGTV